MPLNQLISDQRLAHIRASAFAWLGWLLQIALRIGVLSKSRRLRRLVQASERWVACYCFVIAVQSTTAPRRRTLHPRRATAGFRLTRGHMRLLLKSARIRIKGAHLAARIASVTMALADPEPYVAHFAKRIAAGLIGTHIVIAAPALERVFSVSSFTPALADSS